jgi:hypothetical protein
MKRIFLFILLVGSIICAGCTSPYSAVPGSSENNVTTVVKGLPDLAGNWTGSSKGYLRETEYRVFHDEVSMNIVEQDGRFFKGQVSIVMNGTVVTKDFAGILSRDGKTFETVEYPDGFGDGVMISPDRIELIFRDNADPSRIAIDTFIRSG